LKCREGKLGEAQREEKTESLTLKRTQRARKREGGQQFVTYDVNIRGNRKEN
jgi:hypothetical protein